MLYLSNAPLSEGYNSYIFLLQELKLYITSTLTNDVAQQCNNRDDDARWYFYDDNRAQWQHNKNKMIDRLWWG